MSLELFEPMRTPSVTAAVRDLSQGGSEERGAVFTRREIVEFLLDVAGYTVDRPLHLLRTLEPSFGGGDFLLPMVERLVRSWRAHGQQGSLAHALLAVEVHRDSFEQTGKAVERLLGSLSLAASEARALTRSWLRCDDFLLTEPGESFDLVVGNPPYVRLERIPKVLLDEYRSRYATMYDRADLYVAFIERSLDLLRPGGTLAFVCANRWHKNKYGGPLRQKVAAGYHLAVHVDLVGVDAFHSEVIAYPAITVIRREPGDRTVIVRDLEIDTAALARTYNAIKSPVTFPGVVEVARGVASGDDPWLLNEPGKLALLRAIEAKFPPIEEAGCRVGIGVATGCDRVFVRPDSELDVEAERRLPLIKAPDIRSGELEWGGLALLNPYDLDGKLVQLEDWPRFAAYVRRYEVELRQRNVAKRSGATWFRTIDKVHPDLLATPKLLIPDIKGKPHVVFDPGHYYPHHNLYWVASDVWSLQALQAILRSDLTRLVIEAYCVQMAGGFLRFQAQYLRRIPIPRWETLSDSVRAGLEAVATTNDMAAVNCAVSAAYGLSAREAETMGRP
jgi:hypothetical protein